jgi:hypothetical protein
MIFDKQDLHNRSARVTGVLWRGLSVAKVSPVSNAQLGGVHAKERITDYLAGHQ